MSDADRGFHFFFQAEDGIRYLTVTGVQTCALPIYEKVEGVVRGAHLDGLQSVGPEPLHRLHSDIGGGHAAVAAHQVAGVLVIPALSQNEDEAAALSRSQADLDLQRGAGIESGPELARQGVVVHGGWPRQRAVAS